jgi:hypothetical protein
MVSKCLTKKERAQRHWSAPFEVHSFFGPGWGVDGKGTAPTALAASEVGTADREVAVVALFLGEAEE